VQRRVADDGILRVQLDGIKQVTRLRIEDVCVGTFRLWFVDLNTEEYEMGRRESKNSGHTRTAITELPPSLLISHRHLDSFAGRNDRSPGSHQAIEAL